MTATKSQCDQVLEYIKSNGSITPLEAVRDLGILRLAARVSDLRDRGVRIEREMVSVVNRHGQPTLVASYWIAS